MTLTGVRTTADTWQFTIAGLDPVVAPTFVISYGDGTAPVTVNTHASGTTVVTHQYAIAGHHDYTVTVTANKTPLAKTLAELATLGQTPQSMFPASVATGGDAADYNWG